jgi:hypothetical protein
LPRYGIETRPEVATDTVTVEPVVEFVTVYVVAGSARPRQSKTGFALALSVKPACRFTFPAGSVMGPVQGGPLQVALG